MKALLFTLLLALLSLNAQAGEAGNQSEELLGNGVERGRVDFSEFGRSLTPAVQTEIMLEIGRCRSLIGASAIRAVSVQVLSELLDVYMEYRTYLVRFEVTNPDGGVELLEVEASELMPPSETKQRIQVLSLRTAKGICE